MDDTESSELSEYSDIEDLESILEDSTDNPFPISEYVPPNLQSSVYKNKEEANLVSSGFPLIQFEKLSLNDVEEPWYHKRINRESANSLLDDKPLGTFIVRPSSRPACLALSYVSSKGVIHEVIHSFHGGGYSKKEKPSKSDVFPSLSSLVTHCKNYLHVPLKSDEIEDKTVQRSLKQSSTELISKIVQLLETNEKNLTSLKWELKVYYDSNGNEDERKTLVRYCYIDYVAPDLLPLQGAVGTEIFKALDYNTTLKEFIAHGDNRTIYNVTNDEVLILARSLQKNKCLTSLDLENNQITDVGALYLAKALLTNKTLRCLNLNNNFIHKKGIYSFAKLLSVNDTLENISLRNQSIYESFRGQSTLHSDPYCLFLLNLIESSFQRKKELLGDGVNPKNEQIYSFKEHEEIEYILSKRPIGSYVFYLKKEIVNALYVAISGVSREVKYIVRVPIFRSKYGYTLDISQYQVPSLVDSCLWTIASSKNVNELESQISGDCISKWEKVKNLKVLWGIGDIPTTRPEVKNTFFTLKSLVQNFKITDSPLACVTPMRVKK